MANKFFDPQVKIGWVLSLVIAIAVKGVLMYGHDQQQDQRLDRMNADRSAIHAQIDALRAQPCPHS